MEKAGLYIHVPFCKTKCPYCDFYSITDPSLVSPWLDALLREVSRVQGLFPSFDTVYLGGGTPSLLSPEQMEALVHTLQSRLAFSPDTERTIELNPEDVTPELLRTLRDLGFDRISLGVQSLDDEELQFLGRRHRASHCLHSLERIREMGFANLSVDVMVGLGVRAPENLDRTLERLLEFSPEHISSYQFTLKPGTPFAELQERGGFIPLPEERERECYERTCAILETAGYAHYEVSSFSRDETFRSRHNSKYWRHVPYVGLGPSAHSFDGRSRWWNVRSLETYCRSLARGFSPVEDREVLSDDQLHMERLMLGFRTEEGVLLSQVEGCENAPSILRDLQEEGLIHLTDGSLVPTRSGFLVADSLPLLFLGGPKRAAKAI